MTDEQRLEEFALRVGERLAHTTYEALMEALRHDLPAEDIERFNRLEFTEFLALTHPNLSAAIQQLKDLVLVEGNCRNEVLSNLARREDSEDTN